MSIQLDTNKEVGDSEWRDSSYARHSPPDWVLGSLEVVVDQLCVRNLQGEQEEESVDAVEARRDVELLPGRVTIAVLVEESVYHWCPLVGVVLKGKEEGWIDIWRRCWLFDKFMGYCGTKLTHSIGNVGGNGDGNLSGFVEHFHFHGPVFMWEVNLHCVILSLLHTPLGCPHVTQDPTHHTL